MVTAGMLPRAAVREVEARLRAAGCPDADFDAAELFRLAVGGDARLADAPLSAEQAERLEALTARRAAGSLCNTFAAAGPSSTLSWLSAPACSAPGPILRWWPKPPPECWLGWRHPGCSTSAPATGCLGLGVKRFCPAAQVTSLEKSPAAYRYLEQNAHLSPALTITPVQGDLFTYWQTLPEGQLDLIVSNPPYLTAAEMGELQPEVAREPAMALEAGEDGLVFYRAIAEHYQKALRPGGALALEIGWQQREAVTALLAANGWTDIVCRKDFGGNDRCVMARKQ